MSNYKLVDPPYNGQTTEIKDKKNKEWGKIVIALGTVAVTVAVGLLSQLGCNCNTCVGRTRISNEKDKDDKDLDISGNETENSEDIESVIDDLANKIVKSGVSHSNIDEVLATLTIPDTLVEAAKNWKEQLGELEATDDDKELDESKDDVNTNNSNSNKPSSTPNGSGNSNKENLSNDSMPKEPMQPEQPVVSTPVPTPTPTPVPTPKPHEHSFLLVEEVQPTCTTDGYKLYRCSVDGSERREVLPALGHSVGETHERPGDNNTTIKETTCSRCGTILSTESIKNPDKIDTGTSEGNGQTDVGSGETDEIVFPSGSDSMDNMGGQQNSEFMPDDLGPIQGEFVFPMDNVSSGDANDISSRKNALMELRMFCQGIANYQFIENYSMIETVEDVDLYTVKSYHA